MSAKKRAAGDDAACDAICTSPARELACEPVAAKLRVEQALEASRGPSSAAPSASPVDGQSAALVHAPRSFFALDFLTPKGTRRQQGSLVDIGEPCDSTRPIVPGAKWNGAAVGSWACTEGGWGSPKPRPTTETFIVLDGEASVTDLDGMVHTFGPNDLVVLPKRWSGRWDVKRHIHKLWVVHDHPDAPGGLDGVVRAVVAPVWSCFAPKDTAASADPHAVAHGLPIRAEHAVYEVGPTRVGFWSCSPGSFDRACRASAECLWVVDGAFSLTSTDGSIRRCTAGDTVVLPKGWSGRWDVIEPVRMAWVEVK